jgi:hypothetical protein
LRSAEVTTGVKYNSENLTLRVLSQQYSDDDDNNNNIHRIKQFKTRSRI